MRTVNKAACVGGGVIGSGWAARLAWHGIDVTVCDPHPDVERRGRAVLANAERALRRLHGAPAARMGEVSFTGDLSEAVRGADFIQESAPEDVALKRRLLADIDRHAPADALIGSSTSGLLPSELQADMSRPGRMVVAHPFNPVYLLPLVEVCGGASTSDEAIARAQDLFRALGMFPLLVRTEIDGFIADRLLEALWREALWLVQDDVATVAEIDDAIRYGAGLRWAMMGTFMTYRIAGGEDGMRHFMAQFGPALQWPWTKLMDVPELSDELIEKIAVQSDAQAAGADLRDLERQRDDGLVAILRALEPHGIGAGGLLGPKGPSAGSGGVDLTAAEPLSVHRAEVLPDWIDYNGHMTEHRYLQVFGDSADALFAALGMDAAYLDGGHSFFTVESHLRHLAEAGEGAALHVTTQVLGHDEKRLHVFHRLWRSADDVLLATAEQMYLHVDTKAGGTSPVRPPVAENLALLAAAQAELPVPDGAGRRIGISVRTASVLPAAPDPDALIPEFTDYGIEHTISGASPWTNGARVAWSDGHESRFHGLWLRDNCPCADCVSPLTREQVFDISTVPDDLAPAAVMVDAGGALALTWPDGHESRYHPGWLRAHCYSTPRSTDAGRRLWQSGFAPPRFDGRAVLGDDAALRDWLEALDETGIAIVDNAPLELGAVERFAARIAFLRETNFGRVFDVRSKPDADSNAYTALELPLHTDLPTRELQPGLQFLLCRMNEATGGDSLMADGFAIAEALREEEPEYFHVLSTLPMDFRNRARTSDYRRRVPAIGLDAEGVVIEVRIGNFLRGPLLAAEADVPRIYAAYRHLLEMTRDERFRITFRLEAGQMVAFDNRRVLHARTAFDPSTGARHLQGCYVDTDELKSRLRVLRRAAA